MQPRTAVIEVVRVVTRQHSRLRGLVCEVSQAGRAEREAAAGWLSHYLVLHAAGERLALRRESPTAAQGVVPARHGPLLALTLGLDLDEALIAHHLALLEAALVRHARAQERVVLPRLLATWPLADLHRVVAVLEAADTVFDHGPPVGTGATEATEANGTTDAAWHSAVAALERVLAAPAGAKRQTATLREAMTTAATLATTPTANVTAAVRRT